MIVSQRMYDQNGPAVIATIIHVGCPHVPQDDLLTITLCHSAKLGLGFLVINIRFLYGPAGEFLP